MRFVACQLTHWLVGKKKNMANQWFKFYGAEYLADPKIGSMTAQERSIWITLMCIASTTETNGVIKFLNKEDLLTKAGIRFNVYDTDEWDNALNCLVTLERLNMIKVGEDGSITLLNWVKRQETAMTVAERVAKHREKKQEQAKCNENVTVNVTNVTTDKNRIEENREENTQCVFSKTKTDKPTGVTTADKYTPDGFSPLEVKKFKKLLERAIGKGKSTRWSQLLFGSAWDFKKAYQDFEGRDYAGDVINSEWAKVMSNWYELGETRETIQEMIAEFFTSEKAEKVTITPNSVFSPHTYNSWKQGKLGKNKTKKQIYYND
jgi:hypothetical protein